MTPQDKPPPNPDVCRALAQLLTALKRAGIRPADLRRPLPAARPPLQAPETVPLTARA